MKKLSSLKFLVVLFIATSLFHTSCGDKDNGGDGGTPTPPPAEAPAISAISPERGEAGTVVTVTGTKFGTDKSKVEVRFNTTKATNIISLTDTEVKAEAPAGFSDQTVQVRVFVSNSGSNGRSFYYEDTTPPSITRVSGDCFYGSTLVIHGTNFSIAKEDNIVKFGDVEVTVISGTRTSLTVTTPDIGDVTAVDVTVTKLDMVSNVQRVAVAVDQHRVATYDWTTTTVREGLVYKTGTLSLFGQNRRIHILDITPSATNTLGIGVASPNNKSTVAICRDYDAIAGINAGYFKFGANDNSNKNPYIRINGQTVQEGHLGVDHLFTNSALLINNNVATVRKFTETHRNLNAVAAAIPVSQAQDIMVSGPMLVTNGVLEAVKMVNEPHNTQATARTGIGVTADGKRVMMVVVDYGTITGVNMEQFGKIMQALGTHNAMNLDGGGSSTMFIEGMGTDGRVSTNGQVMRSVHDVIYVK